MDGTNHVTKRGARHLHQQRGVGRRDGEVDKPAAKQHPAYKVREHEHVVVVLKYYSVQFVQLQNLQQFSNVQKGIGDLGDNDGANHLAATLI